MNGTYGRVGVLYGGRSAEREVSLMSGQGVFEALRSVGVDAHLFDTGRYTLVDLINAGFDRVFIALHGRYGEDGDRKSTRLNSSHYCAHRMPSSAGQKKT